MSAAHIAAICVGVLIFSLFVGLVIGPFFAFGSEQDANDRAESEAAFDFHKERS